MRMKGLWWADDMSQFSPDGEAHRRRIIERRHQFVAASGCKAVGKQIYLSDVSKVDPAKWKTVLRQRMQ